MSPTAGSSHDVVFTLGTDSYGFMLEENTDVEERVNDFAPTIGVGDNPAFAEGAWRAWEQSSFAEGVDQRFMTNKSKCLWTDGNVDHGREQIIGLASAWANTDASKTATARQILDFLATHVFYAAGTKIRRMDVTTDTWSDSTTTLAANATSISAFNTQAFAACGAGADFYRSTDLITWTQPAAGQKATCFGLFKEKLWLAYQGSIKSSTDWGATWSAAINVGDANTNITNMTVAFNSLFIRKEDGLYYYDGTNVVEVYTNRQAIYSGNVCLLYNTDGFLYMNELGAIKKFSISSGSITNMVDVTPRMSGDASKELYDHGTPIWMWTGSGGSLHVAFDDGEGVYPEILKYNGLGWHQAYRGTSGQTMNAGGYSRLKGWVLHNDGNTQRRKMVTLKDIPLADYPTSGTLHTSFFDADLPQMPKGFGAVRVWARNVSANVNIAVSYRKTEADAFTSLGTVDADVFPEPVTMLFSATDKAVGANAIQLRFVLNSNSATSTPVLIRFSVKYLNRPNTVHAYSMRLLIKDGQNLLDNSAETATTRTRLSFLRALEDTQTPFVLIDRLGRKRLVYMSRITFDHRYPVDKSVEIYAQAVCIDASEGLWDQSGDLDVSALIANARSLVDQTNFVWGPAGADTFNWSFGQWM